MKRIFTFWCLVASLSLFAGSVMASTGATDADRHRCYIEHADSSITFIFDCTLWGKSSTTLTIYVSGSISGWKLNDEYLMSYDADDNLYYVTVPYDKVRRPGNSGQPEYKFVVNGNYQNAPSWITSGYVFRNGDNNQIVVFSYDDFDQIKANSAIANTIKKITDFNLEDEADQHKISNFRQVPGCTSLFRSYHPFKASRANKSIETEKQRLIFVEYFSSQFYHVKSDICLSEDETGNLKNYGSGDKKIVEHIPDYYQDIIDNNSVIYVGSTNTTPSYNEVYYNSAGDKFCTWMGEVVDFINDDAHKAPFTIHCALGTDRTGVFSATIGALMGASWEVVRNDYQSSNNMGIQEFRDYHLLKYSFDTMLGCDVDTVSDLKALMEANLVARGCVTSADLELMRARLSEQVGVEEIDAASASNVAIYPNPMGDVMNIEAPADIVLVTLFDEAGQCVGEFRNVERSVDVASLHNGVYFLTVVLADGTVASRKVMK